MNGSDIVTALVSVCGSSVIFYFWVRAVKTGRVFAKGEFVEKKKQPMLYWTSMVAYAVMGIALLFYAAVGIFPGLIRHS